VTKFDDQEIADYQALLSLKGRSYVVAGAGIGIGRQTCHALAQVGAEAIICADIDRERAEAIAAEVGNGIPWAGDITSREGVEELAAVAEAELGKVDGLVDIVGQAAVANIFEMTDEMWDAQLDLNLKHVFLLAQIFGRRMSRTGGGSMVFIGSIDGIYNSALHAAYGTAKAGLMAFVQTAAVELGPLGIRVNSVAPGHTVTPRMAEMWDEDLQEEIAAVSPLGRIGQTQDIAGTILFFLQDLSQHITGRNLIVGGGIDSRGPYWPAFTAAIKAATGSDRVDLTP
jgi:NAD(P)-dependent dehydrogenase (short-subunit alcohol dehydrogenase family)